MKAFLNYDDLAERIGISRSSIARLVQSGELPAPLSVRGRRLWLRSTIERWESSLSSAQPAPTESPAISTR